MANICGATAPLAPLLRWPCDLSIYYQYFNPNKIPVFGFGLKRHVPNSGPMTVKILHTSEVLTKLCKIMSIFAKGPQTIMISILLTIY